MNDFEELRFRSDPMQDALHVRIFWAETRYIDQRWATANVQNSFWRLYFNFGEGAGLELAEGLLPLRAETVYFVPAGVRFTCRSTAPMDHFYIHFDLIGLSSIAQRELFGQPIKVPECADLLANVRTVAGWLQGRPPLELNVQCRLKALIYGALGAYLEAVEPERLQRCRHLVAAQEPVLPALAYIEDHLSERLSNEDLAALCHMSEDYFIRRFRECVGQTPAQYVTERRIIIAAQRLIFTNQSIDRIAAETGFANRFYFSRVFSRKIGVSPAAYRYVSRV